jgi:hypothetical protein
MTLSHCPALAPPVPMLTDTRFLTQGIAQFVCDLHCEALRPSSLPACRRPCQLEAHYPICICVCDVSGEDHTPCGVVTRSHSNRLPSLPVFLPSVVFPPLFFRSFLSRFLVFIRVLFRLSFVSRPPPPLFSPIAFPTLPFPLLAFAFCSLPFPSLPLPLLNLFLFLSFLGVVYPHTFRDRLVANNLRMSCFQKAAGGRNQRNSQS